MSEIEIENMPITTTSLTATILNSTKWLIVFVFYPLVNWMIKIFPDWKDFLENFKLIGGAIIIVLVIFKLVLEIVKLLVKKK